MVTFARFIREIVKNSASLSNQPSDFVHRFTVRACEIASNLFSHVMGGMRPITIASVAVYLTSLLRCESQMTMMEVTNASNVTMATLKERLRVAVDNMSVWIVDREEEEKVLKLCTK